MDNESVAERKEPKMNLKLKRVYIPEVFYCPEVFNSDGSVDEIAYGAVPIMCYLIEDRKYYLNNGQEAIEHVVVPLWSQDCIDIVEYTCNKDGICTNNSEVVDFYFNSYDECERYCKNNLNIDLITARLSSLPNKSNNYIIHVNDRIEKLQAQALNLGRIKEKEIKELIQKQKFEEYEKNK